jgi:hypothetical protein
VYGGLGPMDSYETARQRFRSLGRHVQETGCCKSLKAYRNHYRIIVFCPCGEQWVFSYAALLAAPFIVDYFKQCGLDDLIRPLLDTRPAPGVWSKVLLGFLDDPSEV